MSSHVYFYLFLYFFIIIIIFFFGVCVCVGGVRKQFTIKLQKFLQLDNRKIKAKVIVVVFLIKY